MLCIECIMVKRFLQVDTVGLWKPESVYRCYLGFDNQAMKLLFPTDLISWSEYSKGNIYGDSIYLHYR